MWETFIEWAVMMLFIAVLCAVAFWSGRIIEKESQPLPPVAEHTGAVTRYLDVVIKDSDTKGRRQRFTCYPSK